jgi:hypothetical protein
MEGDKSKEAPALSRRYRMLAADLRMSSQDSGEALKALLALVQGGDKEAFTVARLCTLLCAAKDVDQAEKYAGMLPSIAGTEDVDVQVGTGAGGHVHTMSARSRSIYMIYLSMYAMCV